MRVRKHSSSSSLAIICNSLFFNQLPLKKLILLLKNDKKGIILFYMTDICISAKRNVMEIVFGIWIIALLFLL